MKAIFLPLATALAVLCIVSCGKDTNDARKDAKIDTYTTVYTAQGIGSQSETFSINYDGSGRITSVVSTTKPGHRFEYTYNGSDRYTKEVIEDNKVIEHNEVFINTSVALIDSIFTYNNRKDTTSIKNLYNADKQLVKQKQYLHSYLIAAPVWVNTVKYTYDTKGILTKDNDDYYENSYVYEEEIENTAYIQPLYTPTKKLLPSTTFTTRWGATNEIKHVYTFDGSKRVTSETATSTDGSKTVNTYTYK